MSKIHPAENQGRHRPSRHLTTPIPDHPLRPGPSPSVLTVWKKSSMSFQGTDGFTVFDHCGRLVFRVDNYTRKSWAAASAGLLLMDGSGKGLLTLKPQLLSVQHQWTGYRGEDNRCSRAFTMRRPPSLLIPRSACEAEVFIGENIKETSERKPDLKAEGSFRRRNCKIVTTATGELVAQISRKRINTTLLLSDDVFTLVVHPGFEPDLVMAFVIILDRICCQTNYAPILCS
ncbi:protein LURP-one-related 5-like isoform X1 [Coffea eugenioides]|uniref:protein LURP-one-related 5-like isoform X1 n=1 Tax=Coffea eugenioides TaxID=49369 RepID=UPI000F60C2F7|nr:protein LURP-one-related 5-like isoform X1 [Coffea eugenioides]